MRALSLLLLLALSGVEGAAVLPQDQTPLPKEPIKDWKYQLKDLRHDPKTKLDVEEVTLILEGKEATPRILVKDKEVFDLKGIDARYFTTPGKGDAKSREILVRADRGVIDKGARTLKLDDNVRVTRKADPGKQELDTVLQTPSALLRFNRMYDCPVCRKLYGAQGHCPDHGVPLRETTVTSVETDREFEVTGPEGILSGHGLVTDDAMRREYHIARNGFIEFSGDMSGGGARKAPAAQTVFTQVHSRGPLQVTGPMDERVVRGEGGVRVDRIETSETLTLQSETLQIDTVRRWDLSPTGPVEVRKVDAKGDVVLDGVSFGDGESFHATSDTLVRTKSEDDRTDRTLFTAKAPRIVSLTRGPSRIDSRTVTIDKAPEGGSGTSEFTDVVRSDLVAGTQHFSLSCGKLLTFIRPNAAGKAELHSIEATDHVVLGGLMARAGAASPDGAEGPGEARADAFYWDMAANRGRLEGTPYVRITQGPSIILAPKVVLESPEIIVLKGPKNIRLVQERDGKKEEYRATCEGDLVLDSASNRLWMRDRCVLRTQEMVLNSDRVNAVLSPGGKGLESLLALGRVRAVRTSDHTALYGDRLFFRFSDQNLRVYGNPVTVADAGHSSSTQEEIRVYERVHPKTGERIRYTEMIGGPDGVRIEIAERAKDKVDEKKK